MNSDFKDLLHAFNEAGVRYLIVGGYAVIHYSQPRYTKDLDIWVEPSAENARRLLVALGEFGAPLLDLSEDDFMVPGTQLSIGVAPSEIDILTAVPGLEFSPAWENRVLSDEQGLPIAYLSRPDLITAKQTAGRHQDLADIEELRRTDGEEESS